MSSFINHYQQRVELSLENALESLDSPQRLKDAMRYSCLGGGKRIRALFVYAAGLSQDAPLQSLDAVAAALECIHSYSLIHDDLPAMDDDLLRRGNPTNHIQFDEATAILAGDALLTLAFEIVSDKKSLLSDAQSRSLTLLLAKQAGRSGMVGGQMLDILATDQQLNRTELEAMHSKKTGALIYAAVMAGAQCAEPSAIESRNEQTQEALTQYAQALGLAFQVVDDILDIESSTEQLGKQSGADVALNKSTYPSILGLAESKLLAENLYQQAMESLAVIGDNTANLAELAELVIKRKH